MPAAKIKWTPEAYQRLFEATIAAHQIKLNYKAIAGYFGQGATYDTIETRFRHIKKGAEKMKSSPPAEAAATPRERKRKAETSPDAETPAKSAKNTAAKKTNTPQNSIKSEPTSDSEECPSPSPVTPKRPKTVAAGAGMMTPASTGGRGSVSGRKQTNGDVLADGIGGKQLFSVAAKKNGVKAKGKAGRNENFFEEGWGSEREDTPEDAFSVRGDSSDEEGLFDEPEEEEEEFEEWGMSLMMETTDGGTVF